MTYVYLGEHELLIISRLTSMGDRTFYAIRPCYVDDEEARQTLDTVCFETSKIMPLAQLVDEAIYHMVLNYPSQMAALIPRRIERRETSVPT